jgi:hypothetical protein
MTTSHLPGGKPEWTSSDDHRRKEISMSDLAGTAGVIANVDGEDSYMRDPDAHQRRRAGRASSWL